MSITPPVNRLERGVLLGLVRVRYLENKLFLNQLVVTIQLLLLWHHLPLDLLAFTVFSFPSPFFRRETLLKPLLLLLPIDNHYALFFLSEERGLLRGWRTRQLHHSLLLLHHFRVIFSILTTLSPEKALIFHCADTGTTVADNGAWGLLAHVPGESIWFEFTPKSHPLLALP